MGNQTPHLTLVLGCADLGIFLIAALVNLNSDPIVAGIVIAFAPSNSVADVGNFEFKVVLGALSFLIPALLLSGWNLRRARISAVVPAKVVPD